MNLLDLTAKFSVLSALWAAFAALSLGTTASAAPVNGTGFVTPEVIFGTGGNDNGSFTGVTANGVEVGLRAKLRYNGLGFAENTFNYDDIKTYTFDSTLSVAPANRSIFNFEWSINTNPDGTTGMFISDYSYLLSITGPNILAPAADPYDVPLSDHSYCTNATGNGAGVEAANAGEFTLFKDTMNVSQQSWNLGFGFSALPQTLGIYTISLDVFGTQGLVAGTSIDVRVNPVPLPAALPLFGTGLALMGFAGWRRKRNSATT